VRIFNGLQNQQTNQVEYQGDVKGEGISIALAQGDNVAFQQTTQWLILVWCLIPQGRFFLGGFTTNTAAVDGALARFVGFASCPGATGWLVQAVNNFPDDGYGADLIVQTGKCCGGSPLYGVFQPPQPPGSGGDGGSGGFTPPIPPT
jgi:hypothetical protein